MEPPRMDLSWYDSTQSNLVIEHGNSPDWCDVSLGSEDGQEVRGQLRFRRDSCSLIEEPFTAEKKKLGNSFFAFNQSESSTEESKRSESGGIAYQLGMMMVSGAAKVVNNVADGGRQNRAALKQLRFDLDDMNHKYEALELEFENSKQWLTYYENLKISLEEQIEQNNKSFATQHKSMLQQIQKSEKEAQSCRLQLTETMKIKEKMSIEMEEANYTIRNLTVQVEEARKKMTENETKATITQKTSMHCVSTQSETTNYENTDVNLSHDQLHRKERQLTDATKALSVAHARADRLRQQLIASVESMKSQTYQMKASRAALEVALNESRDLKELLSKEMTHKEELQVKLNEESVQNTTITAELRRCKSMLQKLDCNSKMLQCKIKQQQEESELIQSKNKQTLHKIRISCLAEVVVTKAVHDALLERMQNLQKHRVHILQQDAKRNAEHAMNTDLILVKLQQQATNLRSTLDSKTNKFDTLKSDIDSLLNQAIPNQTNITEITDTEEKLKAVLFLLQSNILKLKKNFATGIKTKNAELASLSEQVAHLEEENCNLIAKLKNVEKLRNNGVLKNSNDHTGLRGESKNETSEPILVLENENKELKNQTSDLSLLVEKHKKQLLELENSNKNLRFVMEEDRKRNHNDRYLLRSSEEECRKLSWACKEQYSKIIQLRNENFQLRRYLEDTQNAKCSVAYQNRSKVTSHQIPGFESHNNRSNYLSPAYVDQGNVRAQTSSVASLDTILETDEASSTPTSQLSKSSPITAESKTKATDNDHWAAPQSGDRNYNHPELHTNRDHTGYSSPSRCSDKRYKRSDTKRRKKSLKAGANRIALRLPIWRKESSRDVDWSDLTSEEATPRYPQVNSSEDVDRDNVFLASNAENSPRPQIGIPMSHENFRQIMVSSNASTGCGDAEFSQDDGYSSSTNSINDGLQQMQIWESLLSPVKSTNQSLEKSQLVMSSSQPNENTDKLSKNNDNQSYSVTFANVSFDLAHLSIAQIREITSSCEVTSTQEGMNAFYHFLAEKVEELDNDPKWKGVHKLGRPSDWLSLKS